MKSTQIHKLSSRSDFWSIAAAIPAGKPFVWLDSQLPEHPSSEQSILFAEFQAVLTFDHGTAQITDAEGIVVERFDHENPWWALAEFRRKYPGYVVGYLGYDLKNYTENLVSQNPDDVRLPEMWFGSPTAVYKQDHVKIQDSADRSLVNKHGDIGLQLTSMISENDYIDAVKAAKKAIFEGDIYEVNVSHQLKATFSGKPLDLFDRMYQKGPVPYAAFMQINDAHVCCASPERFLRKWRQKLISDPIKGTRPRGKSEQEDYSIRMELASSAKDRAENLMIVDLVRHDFSRVTKPGSVRVPELFSIQTFGTVHQLVSRVIGELADGISAEEALSACFPMGSMTGAPKIRAMEYIESLETYKRGLYSGAIGFFDPEGDFNFNVVIRSAIIKGESLWYSAGSAITSDSDPQQEWEETLVKVRALGL